ncbi:MAG: helix-turn-helix domain-containing protein [Streptosporangiales bacterium]|nr:helix-turn-helix domain-containing protein [Streptosporangiales bacterium]
MPETRHIAEPHPSAGAAPQGRVGDHQPGLRTTTATTRRLASGATIDWHVHESDQICLPLSGVLAFLTKVGSWVVAAPDRAAWIPAGVWHSHVAHRHTELRSVLLPGPTERDLQAPTVLVVDRLCRELVRTLVEEPPTDPVEYEHLTAALQHRIRHRQVRALHLPEPRDDRLVHLAQLLNAHPGETRTLEQLGSEIGASARTLSRLCRAELGLTFPSWRTQIRLSHSLVLLADGRTVTATASACGWASISTFIACFRDFFGVTPRAYQQAGTPQRNPDAARPRRS